MKTAITLLAVATAVLAPNVDASQSGADPATIVRSSIQESEGELSTDVRRHLDRGDVLSSQMRFAAAAHEYQLAVDIARREGHLASGTTWKLALAHFNGNNLVAGAVALDRLADQASLVGDLGVEALAIYNAAWLYSKAGRKAETAARVSRLKGLLQSRYMPIAIRDDLLGRIVGPSEAVTS